MVIDRDAGVSDAACFVEGVEALPVINDKLRDILIFGWQNSCGKAAVNHKSSLTNPAPRAYLKSVQGRNVFGWISVFGKKLPICKQLSSGNKLLVRGNSYNLGPSC